MRSVAIAAALTASFALPGCAPGAHAAPTRAATSEKDVVSVFRVEYDASVTWNQHAALPDMTEDEALTYSVRGRLPDVTFVNGSISRNVSGQVDATVDGTLSDEVIKPQGTSMSCSGTSVSVTGIAGIGRARKGFWFVPWLSATGRGRCTDTDGGTAPIALAVPPPLPANPAAESAPLGAPEFAVPSHRMDVDRWSEPFRIAASDQDCPRYDASMTISCTFVSKGTLTLTRISRTDVEGENDDLLAPVDEPTLNRKKTKATTTVECRTACDVEALIGVFGGTKKRPKITPLRSTKRRLKANTATRLSLPVTAKARAAAKQGRLVMTLTVTGGRARIYPLM